jgi:hypothetical protein
MNTALFYYICLQHANGDVTGIAGGGGRADDMGDAGVEARNGTRQLAGVTTCPAGARAFTASQPYQHYLVRHGVFLGFVGVHMLPALRLRWRFALQAALAETRLIWRQARLHMAAALAGVTALTLVGLAWFAHVRQRPAWGALPRPRLPYTHASPNVAQLLLSSLLSFSVLLLKRTTRGELYAAVLCLNAVQDVFYRMQAEGLRSKHATTRVALRLAPPCFACRLVAKHLPATTSFAGWAPLVAVDLFCRFGGTAVASASSRRRWAERMVPVNS